MGYFSFGKEPKANFPIKEHRCHDGRVHFTTMMKNADLNEYAIKYIIGHAIEDMTEDVYTRRKPEWLMNEILKIK